MGKLMIEYVPIDSIKFYVNNSKIHTPKQIEQLEIRNGSYLDYEYQDGDIVYCDPPYEDTAEYAGGFDSRQFYDWVMSRPYQVWFSSYQISDKRPRMVWAKGKTNLMAGANGQKQNYECIYTNR